MVKDNTSFLFTKKKFDSLKTETKHKWVIKWLLVIYQKLITNRINSEAVLLFATEYNRILNWLDITFKEPPSTMENRAWVEFVSDAVHFHRLGAGLLPKDHDLLVNYSINITTNDTLNKKKYAIKPLDYYVAVDSFRSVFNVGSLFRITDAAGFKSIILGSTPGSEHPLVQKISMGASAWIKSEKTDDLAAALTDKKHDGYSIIGLETIEPSQEYTMFDWPEKAVLVIGNEEYGISRHVLQICNHFVHIPMFGRKNSINVANAASVVMFHIAGKLNRHQEQWKWQ